jgi:hypothetical protein
MSNDLMITALSSFLALWNVEDENARRTTAQRILVENVSYVDVHTPERIQSIDAMLSLLYRFRQFAPDAEVVESGPAQAHHDVGRISFNIMRGGKRFTSGAFVMRFHGGGKIGEITGFLD